MSGTTPGVYQNVEFWVADVCGSILLAEMITVAEEADDQQESPWLARLVPELRVHAVVGADFLMPIDEWATGHEDEFTALVAAACTRLSSRGVIAPQQAARWLVIGRS